MTLIKSIDTFYNGNYYRSRLEARWAVFFDMVGIKYLYEPEGFENKIGERYLPDFYLPEMILRNNIHKGIYIEIKNEHFNEDFIAEDWFDKPLILFKGNPIDNIWNHYIDGGDEYGPRFDGSCGYLDNCMLIWLCSECRTFKIEFSEGHYNECPSCGNQDCCNEWWLKYAAEHACTTRFEHRQHYGAFSKEHKSNLITIPHAIKKLKAMDEDLSFRFAKNVELYGKKEKGVLFECLSEAVMFAFDHNLTTEGACFWSFISGITLWNESPCLRDIINKKFKNF
jgi:hypothetical protein